MRVDLTYVGLEPTDKNKAARAEQSGAGANQVSAIVAPSVDRANLSFDQARVRSLEAQALGAPEIREAKVAALRLAIGNGDYAVDVSKVADAMRAELGA